jgi:electron transport complex protein RnfD
MTSVIVSSPYVSQSKSLRRLMINVIIGLIPGTLAYAWFFGPSIMINIAIAVLFALGFEAFILWLRKKSIKPHLNDYSAVVTGWLFALCLPSHSVWWLIVVGIGFAMIAGKHLYGGLGFNPFNPAMVGYVVLLISFPKEMTSWHLPIPMSGETYGLVDSLKFVLGIGDSTWDAFTAATPLDHVKTALRQDIPISEIFQAPLFGKLGGIGWEWISAGWLIGGLWLLINKTIRWHIPVALLGSLGSIAWVFYLIDAETATSPLFHWLSGGAMLGAFFIATDPVSAATTNSGRIYYGILIGLLVYLIRNWGGYPDGVAFAVLLANMCVPLIDYYTQPKVYGAK